jgi:hypothetical protein
MFFNWPRIVTIVFLGVLSQNLYATSCDTVKGYDQILKHHLVMVGEMHGTREVPEYFGELVCSALATESSVAIGLELPVAMAPALDEYLDSDNADAVEKLLNDPSWSPTFQDGRLSEAMLQLIQKLATLKARHEGQLSVHLIDAPEDYRDGEMPKSRSLAAHIRKIINDSNADYLFTLTGNFHNRINVPPDQSAATALSELEPFTVTLSWQKGQAWMCAGATPDNCGDTRLPNRDTEIEEARIVLNDDEQSRWHARLEIPLLSASPPAVHIRRDSATK